MANLHETNAALTTNSGVVPLKTIPRLGFEVFRREIIQRAAAGGRVMSLFGVPVDGRRTDIFAVVEVPASPKAIAVFSTHLETNRYESMTLDCPEVHLFERELGEQCGLIAERHPWFKPVRYAKPLPRPGGNFPDPWSRDPSQPFEPAVTDFYAVVGPDVHQVAVGPVHAGVIEPGHFRFQCRGEVVLHLEIQLGYQHRGVEEHLVGGPFPGTRMMIEAIAGDTTIGHSTAYCQILESLGRLPAPSLRAEMTRAIALELERMANHTGDLGAIAGDTGYLPTAQYNGRIRGDFLNASGLLCGSRFGRSTIRPGGVGFHLDPERARKLLANVTKAFEDVCESVDLMFDSPSVLARLEGCGTVKAKDARALGLVGYAARACGLKRDVRLDHPFGAYRKMDFPVSGVASGDVFARSMVRYMELKTSFETIRRFVTDLPENERPVTETGPKSFAPPLVADALCVSLVEGWRGEICHTALTGPDGQFTRYKVVDPSFHNWPGLQMALRDQQISDFPLNNKSFNQSYCGFDL